MKNNENNLGYMRAELAISVRGEHNVILFVPMFDEALTDLNGQDLSEPWPMEMYADRCKEQDTAILIDNAKVLGDLWFNKKAGAVKYINYVNKHWDEHKRRRLSDGFYTEVNCDGFSIGHDDEDLMYAFQNHFMWFEDRVDAENEVSELLASEAYLSWKTDAPRRDALKRYSAIKDELMAYTDRFHDAMLYDIEGYNSDESDADDIKDLIVQVDAFESILKGIKALKYKFG